MGEKPEIPPPSSLNDYATSVSADNLPNGTGDHGQLTSSSREDEADAGRHHRHSQSKARPRRTIGNYTLVSTLGSGSMGKVKLAVHNITQEKLAVKIVRKQHAKEAAKHKDENREVRTIREASIMLLLHHPHIVSLKEMVVLDDFYYMFMEYVGGGQLLDYIISHGKLKERHARRFARQILSALDYCHRNSIVHRDLKIENILISQQGNVKIIDFGLSNLFSPRSHLSTFCGSLYFAAPELLHAKAYTGPEVDVWSFGIVLFVLVCGKVPFDDQNMSALHQKIKRGHVDYPSHLSSDCKNLLSRMLVTNPNHRATISEIMVHPWMNKGYDELVDNHLPDRAPLMLPVDTEVIRNMTGFGFGTEAEIKQQLETIITSEEYQKAAKTLAQRTRDHHHSHDHIHNPLSTSRFTHHSAIPGKKAPSPPTDDPQSIPAAYHPLVSIYYLVKERMERERRAASERPYDDRRISRGSLGSTDDIFRLPDISRPETAHPADTRFEYAPFANAATSANSGATTDDAHGLFRRATTGVAFGKKGRTNIRVDDDGNIIDADRPNILEAGLQKLMNRQFGGTSDNSNSDSNGTADEGGGLYRSNTMLKRLGTAFQRPSADASSSSRRRSHNSTDDGYVGPVPIPSHSEKSKEKQGHGRKESLGHRVGNFLSRAGSTAQKASTTTQRRPRQATISGGNPTVEDRVIPGKAPAQPLPEFLSVSHSHEQTFPQPASTAGSSAIPQGTADQTVKQVFLKGLFSVTTTSTKHPSVIRADLIRVLERLGVKWRESKGRFECQHMPSIDVKQVVGKDSSDDSQAATPVTVPDLVVRFEIYIVKVSWLMGMHGLQFRRVSGDPWLYKNMCSRILAELKL